MVFVIAVFAVIFPILLGSFLAWIFAGMDTRVIQNRTAVEARDRGYNAALTFGFPIKAQAESEQQLAEARLLAAKQAAALPRGANMRIGTGAEFKTAGNPKALKNDPMTAVRIATHHGWDGAKTGAVPPVAVAAAPAAVAGKPAAPGKINLVPGKDYAFIQITDDMSPADKRKARIANAKAKSAAMKAAKAAGVPAAAAPVAGAAAPVAVAAAPVEATAVAIEPPQLIEITDTMSADDKRKATISNSKAKSAFNKALKAAGIDPSRVEIVDGKVVMPDGAAAVATVVAPEVVENAQPAIPAAVTVDATATGIPKPDLIEITDDMSPDEKRRATISNSKAKSAYNKALKAAGIDPSTVA